MALTARLDSGAPACVKCGNGGFKTVFLTALANLKNPGVEAIELTCLTCGFVEQRAPLDAPKV